MTKNKLLLTVIGILVVVTGIVSFYRARASSGKNIISEEIRPRIGDIRLIISTTGLVEPQNRLEIKPSISGRIEDILVQEGDLVKKGQILAWMSSTERAALIDAAISEGAKSQQYWEQVYKKTPIISPINGKVIVRAFEPGQTITTSDALLVLSDRLIVKAQFDETDIGRVKIGQKAVITLDAYPGKKIDGVVDHIAYESELVNNVTIYDVDIVPNKVPDFFRSGMTANVDVIQAERKGVIVIPLNAVQNEGGKKFVIVKKKKGGEERRWIKTGLEDATNVEVVSGLTTADTVIVREQKYVFQKKMTGANPFMPSRKK